MPDNKNIFVKKKILIYGLGKSGFSTYLFLRKNNDIYLYDDNKNVVKDNQQPIILHSKDKKSSEKTSAA